MADNQSLVSLFVTGVVSGFTLAALIWFVAYCIRKVIAFFMAVSK